MTTFQKLKHEARRAEQRSDWRKAINLYREALRLDERRGGPDELGLYNRIGDLHIRLGEVPQAVECYETAADRYAENQLPTSAVALCNKILRVAPERTDVFRRIALLHAATGLIVEARSSLLQYVDRMEAAEELERALEGVQQFVDVAGDESIREAIADLLEGRGHRSQAVAQLRLAAASARRRGEDASSLEARLRELNPPAGHEDQPASETELPPTPRHGPEPAAPAPESEFPVEFEAEVPRIRLEDCIAAAFESDGGQPAGYAPGGVRLPSEKPVEPEGLVATELAEFRSGIGDTLFRGGAHLNYELGVAFHAMGLDAAAAEELGASMLDPTYARRAAERIGYLFGDEQAAIRESNPDPTEVLAAEPPTPVTTEAETPTPVTTEAETPEVAIEDSLEPEEEETPKADLQALFFRARLAQYQIRKAEDSGRTDHRSHLDLGVAYAEMGLAVEAVRELTAAASADGHVAARATSILLKLAGDAQTEPELALEILDRVHAEAPSVSIVEVLDQLGARWGEAHPLAGRLAALEALLTGQPADPPEPEPPLSDPEPEPEDSIVPQGTEGTPPSLEALDEMLEQLEGDAFRIVVPVGRTPMESAASLCAEADELIAADDLETGADRLYRALELLEDAQELREAIRVVDRLLALRPEDVVLHHQRAEFALGLDDRDLLIESYMELASSLRRQNAPESARTVYVRILEVDPTHAAASQALDSLAERAFAPSRDEVDLGGPPGSSLSVRADAVEPSDPPDFDALLEDLRDPAVDGALLEGDAQAHFELGIAFKQMEMWEEAISELEQATFGREDPRPVWEAMAECCIRMSDSDRALKILLEAESHPMSLSDPSLAVWYRIAVLLEERGDRPGAAERLRRVVEADPDYRDAAGRLSALSR
jgi:tetratricopeptide (TPR) repeat protein